MHMKWLHDPSCRFNFSSIISICEGEQPRENLLPAVEHRNRYRQIMLEREFNQSFWTILEKTKPKYIFIDLVEERFNLILAGTRYLTKSDAYDGLTAGKVNGREINRFSLECTALWQNSAKAFVQRICSTVSDIHWIIVETLLAETVGDINERLAFPQLDEIRQTNALLSDYYSFLKTLVPEATVIRPSENPLWFTDAKFEYGAIPSHYNELLNQHLAESIERQL